MQKIANSMEKIEQTITYNTLSKTISKNLISRKNINIELSNIDYNNENENLLILDFKFSTLDNKEQINDIGFILRVYNSENFLGDRIIGKISTNTSKNPQYYTYNRIFYENIYGNKKNIDEKNMLQYVNFNHERYLPDDGSYINKKFTFKLPDNYEIKNNLNISLFDITYQIVGNPNYYNFIEPLGELNYIINFK